LEAVGKYVKVNENIRWIRTITIPDDYVILIDNGWYLTNIIILDKRQCIWNNHLVNKFFRRNKNQPDELCRIDTKQNPTDKIYELANNQNP
jgi:hypothetical protein